MNDLPKRNDKIYKEIEEFKDYELTYCVAYEMAIRNDEVKRLLEKVFVNKDSELGDSDTIKKLEDFGFTGEAMIFYILNNSSTCSSHMKYQRGIKNQIKTDYLYSKNEGLYNEYLTVIDNKVFLEYEDGNIKSISLSEMSNKARTDIRISFLRPRLFFKEAKNVSLHINLSLPHNELMKQMEEIIKNIKSVKSIYEFFNQDLCQINSAKPTKNYPKRPKAEQLADMFFIYDYATYRMKEVKEYNERYKAELDEKLSFIKNDKTLTAKEKKIQEMEAKKEFIEAKSEAKIKSICNEDDVCNQVGLQGDSVYKYYLAIKPYIEEKRYKELITGVSIL